MTKLVFIDTETTGLRPDRRAWDVGLIVRDRDRTTSDVEHQWLVDADFLDLGNADPFGLRVGKFYERHPQYNGTEDGVFKVASEYDVLAAVEVLTRDAVLVGAVPNFDAEVLGTRMRANDILPSWHYHLVDVETLAAGAMRLSPPWGFDDILAAYGLTYDEADRHTALGDARMARDLYDAVMSGKQPAVEP